jgi:hypothetical protein
VPGVVTETVWNWESTMRKFHRPNYQGEAKTGLEAMGRLKQEPVGMLAGHEIPFYLVPQELDGFIETVGRVVPNEVFAKWNEGRLLAGEARRKQGREWVEAGFKMKDPAKEYRAAFDKFLEQSKMVLSENGADYLGMVKMIEEWAKGYAEKCRELSLLRVDSFLLTGPGWTQAKAKGSFLQLAPKSESVKEHLATLKGLLDEKSKLLLAAVSTQWEKESFKLELRVEAAWSKHLKEARELHIKSRAERMSKEVVRLQKEFELSDRQVAHLQAKTGELSEAAVLIWEQSMRRLFRLYLTGDADRALKKLAGEYSPGWLAAYPAPYQQETVNSAEWEELIKGVLSVESFSKWKEQRDKEMERRERETKEMVAAGLEKMEPTKKLKEAFDVLLVEMAGEAEDEEWMKPIRSKVEGWLKQYVKACEERSVLWLDACHLTGSSWTRARKTGYYLSLLPIEDWVSKHRDELMEMMPEEVMVAHRKGAEEREAWMTKVIVEARLMIVEKLTPLDKGQLKAVNELAAKLPTSIDDPLLNPESDPEHWRVWKGPEALKELNKILDDRQERMVAKGLARLEKGNSGTSSKEEVEAVVLRHPSLGQEDPVAVEAVVSAYLAEQSRDHAMRALESLMREVDALVRVLNLDETARERLELAAKGTAQAAEEAYRVNQGRWIRGQAKGATAAVVRQRLKSMGGYSFDVESGGETLLDEALDEVTDEKQKEVMMAYQEEVKSRRNRVIAEVALARIQKALGLGEKQREQLGKAMTRVMEKYGKDIETNFQGWGERMPWYLQSYYMLLPGAGVAQGELKAMLSERQLEIWDEQVMETGGHYWGQILEYHDQRMRNEGNQKSKRRIFFER